MSATGCILAEKTINAKGGLNGRPIRIIIEDDTSNPDTAVTKVNDLIFNQKVITVFGGSLLGPAVAIGGITDSAKIPQLTFTGLGPAVELKRKCVFHMLPPHELNARGLFEYARSIGAKKVGVLHDTGYGNVVMRELNNVAGDYKDIQFVGPEKYEMAATDATAQAAKLRALQAGRDLRDRHHRDAVPRDPAVADEAADRRGQRRFELRSAQRHGANASPTTSCSRNSSSTRIRCRTRRSSSSCSARR